MRKAACIFFFLLVSLFFVSSYASGDSSTVDLSDKQGVVDPQDLKQHDPKPGSLKINEPPPPEQQKTETVSPPPTDQGSDTSRGNLPLSGKPLHRIPPPPPFRPVR